MNFQRILAALALLASGAAANADVKLASPFSDNMVLQREMPVPVWGKADPGEEVKVSFAGQSKGAKAGDDGKWSVKLDALKASKEPAELKVDGKNEIVLKNVLVGEVWVCSGQSNMEMSLRGVRNAQEEIANAKFPLIRALRVPNAATSSVQDSFKGDWKICSPETAGGFTATGYFFARELTQRLDIPVGLLMTYWGGTPAEAWTPLETLESDPDFAKYVAGYKKMAAMSVEERNALNAEAEKKARQKDSGNEGAKNGWQKADAGSDGWKPVASARRMEDSSDIGNIDGAVWFKKEVELPAAWAKAPLTVELGVIADTDNVYFNGVEIGATGQNVENYWKAKRKYQIPEGLANAGRNTIAVRVFNEVNNGGLLGPASDMKISKEGEKQTVALSGEWLAKIEKSLKAARPNSVRPHCAGAYLYNAMIAPLIPYAIRGAIWYQGEANAGDGYGYRKLFPAMIKSWRENWQQGDFPFYFVQLANFMARKDQPGDSAWAELREAQTMTLALPNTGMAVIIDIGEAEDIHPKNKQDVGKRLALSALAQTYGEKIEFLGPFYKSMKVEDGKIRLSFDHIGSGLEAKGGKLSGFAICGEDKKFVWAEAQIDGNEIVVSSANVKEPVAVRYAWADNPDCSLCNKEGIPASPFRTDKFPIRNEPAAK